MTPEPLRIVHLEDSPLDAELIAARLETAGFMAQTRRVETREAFTAALREPTDVILGDFFLPGFDGIEALGLARKAAPEVPFIFVSGVLGEERAIETLKGGATDYVLKGNLERLAPSIRRALREASERVERASAQASLRESEQRLRSLAEAVPGVIFTATPDGRADYINQVFFDYTGTPPGSANGMGWTDSLHPDDADRTRAYWSRCVRDGTPFEVEFRLRGADGEHRWFMTRGVPMRDDTGRTVRWFGTCIDIDGRKRAEAELADHRDRLEEIVHRRTRDLHESLHRLALSRRMAAIGTLSAGLGHDLGNLLLPIRAWLDVMQAHALPEELHEGVDAIRRCAEYLQRLSSGLRLLALDPADASATAGETDLKAWWLDMEPLFKNALPRHVSIEGRVAEGLPAVRVAPHRLTQAVLNLVTNSGDALRDRPAGRVVFEALAGADPALVRVSVRDDGPGMTPAILQRAMEPFFTTKTLGMNTGTGLGLALVHSLVESAGGRVEIRSPHAHGEGAEVTLTLNAIKAHAGGGAGAGDDGDDAGEGDLAVLSIGDTRLRLLLRVLTGSMGYESHLGSPRDPEAADAGLWITDAASGSAEEAVSFMGGGKRRRVVLVGPGAAGWEGPGGAEGRFVHVASMAPSDLRIAIATGRPRAAGTQAR